MVKSINLRNNILGGTNNWGLYLLFLIIFSFTNTSYAENEYQTPPYKISGAFGLFQDVTKFLISPDGTTVVYIADLDTDEKFELYSVPIEGGTSTKLNGSLDIGEDTFNFKISNDSSRVIYTADQDTNNKVELYSVLINGTGLVKLNDNLIPTGNVSDFLISNDSGHVVYLADQTTDELFEIYSVPITGGTKTALINTIIADGDVTSFQISPDNSRVIFIADKAINEIFELYTTPISGGVVTRLNDNLVDESVNEDYKITGDSLYVIYRANQDSAGVTELYSNAIAGGSSVKLNSSLAVDNFIFVFKISPDSNSVAYLTKDRELLTTSTHSQTATQINSGSAHNRFLYSQNSQYIIYTEVNKLYRADIGSGYTLTELGLDHTSHLDVKINTTSTDVVYRHGHGLYSTKITGGPSKQLDRNESSPDSKVEISPDGSRVVILSKESQSPTPILFGVDINGLSKSILTIYGIEPFLLKDFKIESSGTYLVYLVDQAISGKFELFVIKNFGRSEDNCFPITINSSKRFIHCF